MYRNPDTGYWEEDFRRKGVKRLHVSYGVKKKDDATPASAAMHRLFREKRVELIEKVRRGEITAHQIAGIIADEKPLQVLSEPSTFLPWLTLGEACEQYVTWLRTTERRSATTAGTAESQLKSFREFAGDATPVDQVTSTGVIAYQRHLQTKFAINTVTGYVWRVSGLFSWLVRREKKEAREQKRPARALEVPIDQEEITTKTTRRERALLEPEAGRLIDATPTMLLFPVLCGLLAGLRIDETVHLRPGHDIDTTRWLITVQEQPGWHPKNRKRRFVPIAKQLRPVIQHHLAHYASEQWMLPSAVNDERPMADKTLQRHFKRIVENAELVSGNRDPSGVVYHTLRHTFASWLVMKGVDLYTVSRLLGNSLKMVENTYSHLAPDFRQRAVDNLSGIVQIPTLPQTDEGEKVAV